MTKQRMIKINKLCNEFIEGNEKLRGDQIDFPGLFKKLNLSPGEMYELQYGWVFDEYIREIARDEALDHGTTIYESGPPLNNVVRVLPIPDSCKYTYVVEVTDSGFFGSVQTFREIYNRYGYKIKAPRKPSEYWVRHRK